MKQNALIKQMTSRGKPVNESHGKSILSHWYFLTRSGQMILSVEIKTQGCYLLADVTAYTRT